MSTRITRITHVCYCQLYMLDALHLHASHEDEVATGTGACIMSMAAIGKPAQLTIAHRIVRAPSRE